MTYAALLEETLRGGLAALGPGLVARHLPWLLARQESDGGFPGRRGPSDPYYTDFGLRLLALLEGPEEAWSRAAGYLACLPPPADPVGLFSRLSAARLLAEAGHPVPLDRPALAAALDRWTLPEGGFTRPGAQGISAYHTFVGALCREELGLPQPDPAPLAAALGSLARPAGGCAESPGMAQPQTSATAAVAGWYGLHGGPPAPVAEAAAEYLTSQQAPDGGLRAHPQAPAGDLLSTFTGLVALLGLAWSAPSPLEGPDGGRSAAPPGPLRPTPPAFGPSLNLAAMARFVRGLVLPGGGFRAAAGDDQADMEYSYYGLGVAALLAATLPD